MPTQAQPGDDVVIASRGKPVARIVPIRESQTGAAAAGWLRAHQVARGDARSQAEVNDYLSAERDAWA